jgi:hypothetical protein
MHPSSLSRMDCLPDVGSAGHIPAKPPQGQPVIIVSVDRDSVEPCPQNK